MDSLNKYAKVDKNVIDSITFYPDRDENGEVLPPWIPVSDDVFAGYVTGLNGIWIPPEPEEQSEPEPTDSTAVTVGIAQLNIVNGEVAALPLSSRFTAAMQMGTGEFWVFFKETQPDTNYLALVYPVAGAFAFVQESNKFEDFFIISVTDFAGNPTDAECLSLEVKRVG